LDIQLEKKKLKQEKSNDDEWIEMGQKNLEE
jgi:hypothetical protein